MSILDLERWDVPFGGNEDWWIDLLLVVYHKQKCGNTWFKGRLLV